MLRLEPTIDLIAGEPEPQLSENALRVLEKRYLKKDETGKVTETPRELFWRVSWNLAQADRLYGSTEEQVIDRARTFYRMLAALEFLPNSPTLMNAGLELQQLSACFAAGTPISTKDGPKPIEEVRAGDLVLTHAGRYRRVVATMRREAPVLRIQVHHLPAMLATEDHPFLTPEGWVRAGDLAGKHVRVEGTAEPVTRTEIEFEEEVNGQLFELAVGLGHTLAMMAEYMPANASARPWPVTLGGTPMYVRDGAHLVESVEPVAGVTTVYNLEVEEDNTYVANGVVVHNCFVLPVEDSLSGIFQTLKESALIHQCLAGDSLIMTDRGLVPIRDAVDAFRVDTEAGALPMTHHWVNGRQAVHEIRTSHGHTIRATAEHRFLAVAGDGEFEWRRVQELHPGDWLVLSAGSWLGTETVLRPFSPALHAVIPGGFQRKPINLPDALTDELAELIGLYMGDGSNSRWGIRFTGNREEVDRIAALARRAFGVDPTIRKHKNIWEASILRLDLREWWRVQGFTKTSSLDAFVPEAILRGPESCAVAFLRGLFGADGCVRVSGHITLSTSSRTLARQIPVVMFHLGVPTRVSALSRPEGGYQISVCSKQGFEVFQERIGFGLSSKDRRLAAVPSHEIFVRGERVPNQEEPLKGWYRALDEDGRRLAIMTLRGPMWAKRGGLSRHHVGVLYPQGFRLPAAVEERSQENYLYSRISEIVPGGEADVYDLTVESKHSYLANGFVSHNSGGGTGFSFSRLRPKNDFVRSTMGVASGPVSFMKVFDAATQQVKQGSRRRGANMGILRVDHPDILEFITCKDDIREITNFNISVAVTDRFMEAVAKGERYDLVSPRTGKVAKQLDAREVFEKIAHQAWKNGEPGMFFIDETNRRQSCNHIGAMEATNPCGEQPLLPYESCNLGSVNLEKHMVRGKGGTWDVDWKKLERTIRTAARMLDNVVDMNHYPVKQIEEMTKATRKIGLGVMGFARMLFMLEVPYDSPEGVAWGKRVMKFVEEIGYDESRKLAEERGPYPAWEGSQHWKAGQKVRNSYVTTVAPTGTLSMIADTSGGCEPEFSLLWFKRVMEGTELPYSLEYFEEVAKREGFWTPDLAKRVLENQGRARGLRGVPEKWQKVFAVSFDVSPEAHVRMQAAFQDHCDAAVSKCITGDSWIFTDRGMIRIGSLYRGEAPDTFSNRDLRVASNPSVADAREYYYGGVQPVIRVSTDLGLELGGTPVHRVKAVDGGRIVWKSMASLRPGDRLLVEYGYGLFGNEHEFAKVYGRPFGYTRRTNSKDVRIPYKITKDLARLLGYLVADGGWNVNSMYLTNEDDAILEDFRATVARRFGARTGTVADRRTRATRTVHADSREIVSFLRDYLRVSNRAETKTVPEIVLRSGREIQKEFLRGLTLDGYVRADGRLVPLTTTSRELAVQTQMMLLNLGIPSIRSEKKIQYDYKDEANRKRSSYEVAVVPDWRKAFVETVGFAEERKQRAARGRLRVPGDTYHGVPAATSDLELLASEKARIVRSQRLREQLRGISQRARAGWELSRDSLLWFLDVTSDLADRPAWNRLSELVHQPFVYARVEGTSYGHEEVHDFHVPSNNTFVANGFVSHNTINLPREATVEDVTKAYHLAFELKCKGITVYRDGSRNDQVLNVGVAEEKGKAAAKAEAPAAPVVTRPRPRPDTIKGQTQKILTGYGPLYVTINEDDKGLFELFAAIGRGGGYTASFSEGIGRLVSLCLRSGVPVDEIIDQLEGIRSPRLALDHGERVYSIPDAIAKAIKRHIGMQKTGVMAPIDSYDAETGGVHVDDELEKEAQTEDLVRRGMNPECPECGRTLVLEEGCAKCRHCGYSEC